MATRTSAIKSQGMHDIQEIHRDTGKLFSNLEALSKTCDPIMHHELRNALSECFTLNSALRAKIKVVEKILRRSPEDV
jgi:hypothetical protein